MWSEDMRGSLDWMAADNTTGDPPLRTRKTTLCLGEVDDC